MDTFLKDTCNTVYQKYGSFDAISFVLPSKRAGVFLKKYISETIHRPIFNPKIYSIEELIIEISGLQKCTNLNLQLTLFEAHQQTSKEELSFESFVLWSNSLLSDFNEIDRHLIDADSLFSYLSATKRLKKWGIDGAASPLIEDSLKFWDQLKGTYENFKNKLLKNGLGYQGLLYRKAADSIGEYLKTIKDTTFIFTGFNAFNTAEEKIVQSFLATGNAEIFWDLDAYFLKDNIHEAGYFIRDYFNKWPYLKQHPQKGISHYFLEPKTIKIIGVPKAVSQAKYAGKLIENRLKKDEAENIALVLAEETLLPAIMNSLPDNSKKVNVTMGIPLKKTNLFIFFQALFDLHIAKSTNGWYYKDVNKIVSSPYAQVLLQQDKENLASTIKTKIKERNLFYMDHHFLASLPSNLSHTLHLLFPVERAKNAMSFVSLCQQIVEGLKYKYQKSHSSFELHILYGFFQLFNQLESYVTAKPYLKT